MSNPTGSASGSPNSGSPKGRRFDDTFKRDAAQLHDQSGAQGIASLRTVEYLRQRAAGAKLEDFDRLLAMVPDVEPEERDRIPSGGG